MFDEVNQRSIPIPISNTQKPMLKGETNTSYNRFDPFASSPPNDFIRKLNQRMIMHDNNHFRDNDVFSRIKSLSLKKE